LLGLPSVQDVSGTDRQLKASQCGQVEAALKLIPATATASTITNEYREILIHSSNSNSGKLNFKQLVQV